MSSTEHFVEGGDLRDTARLLHDVFGAPRFRDERYLDWYYRQNPLGPAIETDVADEQGRLGHIGGVPHVYHSQRGTVQCSFPLNVAVHERGRGRGLLARLTARQWASVGERFGQAILLGMANAQSAPFYMGKAGYRLQTRLPATICPPMWPELGPVEHHGVDAAFLRSAAFDRIFDSLDLSPTEGYSERWTREGLAWRLSQPDAGYAVHVGRDVVIVSALEERLGIPFLVVGKTFRRTAARSPRPVANGVIARACRYRGRALGVYGGFSATTRVFGAPLPERLKPSPLHLVVNCHPAGWFDLSTFRYDTFEFLDFDAY